MPNFDWSSTGSASVGGGVFTIPNDGYVCVITDAWWCVSNAGANQLKLTWDVAEGPYANVCADNGWFDSKHVDYISFAPRALRFAGSKLDAISASNPGHDAKATLTPLPDLAEARRAGMPSEPVQVRALIGLRVGLLLKLEYGEWQGRQTKKMRVDGYKTADDIRAGRFNKPVTEEPAPEQPSLPASVPPTYGQQASTSGYAEDIPF